MKGFKIILKQHTPIIHFQHDQQGATLRATEVKPKLDKFIIEKMGGWDKIPIAWKVGAGNSQGQPLNYKLHLRSKNTHIELIEQPKWDHHLGEYQLDKDGRPKVLSMPSYFGNMGLDIREESKLKKFLFSEEVSLKVFSYSSDLVKTIEQHLPEFFATHNFGNRQTKGFGSFYPENCERSVADFVKYNFSINISNVTLPKYARIEGRSDIYQLYFKLFYAINTFYSSLRSGINFGGLYFKSLMFMYAKSKDIQWDKKTIRDHFHLYTPTYQNALKRHTNPAGTFRFSAKEKRLMRDILGLSTEQSWLAYRDTITKESKEKDDRGKPLYARFASPILFKVIRRNSVEFDVFIHPRPIPEILCGQIFIIKSQKNSGRGPLPLALPKKGEFDLDEFLEFCFKKIFPDDKAFDRHVNNSSSPEARLLKSIYAQLRNC